MNQILLTDNDNNKKRNSNKNINRNNSNDIKKIIIFFAIVILVFGIAIGGVYGYKIYKNSNKEETTNKKLILELEEAEENVRIVAESEAGIAKIIYTWNEEDVTEIPGNGGQNYEKMLDIPEGENTLNVKLIDVNGQKTEKTMNFSRAQQNSDKITINTSVENDGKLKIVATSELPIEYIAYKWNDEEEVKVEAQNEGDVSIEATTDILRGQNTITITAVDTEGNKNSIEKNFDGRLKPEFDVHIEGNRLYMKISHDMGFEKVEFSVNGAEYVYDENFAGYDAQKQEIEYYFDLVEGENTVIIRAVSNEDTEDTYAGKCNYTAQ